MAYALRQAKRGAAVADAGRHLAISGMRRLRQLGEEDHRLKPVRRLYRLEGLQLRLWILKRSHRALHRGPVPTAPDVRQRWSMDFVHV